MLVPHIDGIYTRDDTESKAMVKLNQSTYVDVFWTLDVHCLMNLLH